MVKSADGVLVAGVKVRNGEKQKAELHCLLSSLFICLFLLIIWFQDVDDFFEHEKTFLLEYHNRVKDASAKSDRMIRSHKSKRSERSWLMKRTRSRCMMGNVTKTQEIRFSPQSL